MRWPFWSDSQPTGRFYGNMLTILTAQQVSPSTYIVSLAFRHVDNSNQLRLSINVNARRKFLYDCCPQICFYEKLSQYEWLTDAQSYLKYSKIFVVILHFMPIEIVENLTITRKSFKFPSESDFDKAALDLLRIQGVYQLEPEHLAVGEVNGIKLG